jgi:hypothetical protein
LNNKLRELILWLFLVVRLDVGRRPGGIGRRLDLLRVGNSDPSGTSYDPVINLAESVVKLSGDLSRRDYLRQNDVSF